LVVVVRFQGLHANGMPELHKLTPPLAVLRGKGHRVALLTDGRMSGASGKVPAAIHCVPEALDGGLVATLHDGDTARADALAGCSPVTPVIVLQREAEAVTPGPGCAQPAPRGGSSKAAEPHLLENGRRLQRLPPVGWMLPQSAPSQRPWIWLSMRSGLPSTTVSITVWPLKARPPWKV
jgi:hypothetical protein